MRTRGDYMKNKKIIIVILVLVIILSIIVGTIIFKKKQKQIDNLEVQETKLNSEENLINVNTQKSEKDSEDVTEEIIDKQEETIYDSNTSKNSLNSNNQTSNNSHVSNNN